MPQVCWGWSLPLLDRNTNEEHPTEILLLKVTLLLSLPLKRFYIVLDSATYTRNTPSICSSPILHMNYEMVVTFAADMETNKMQFLTNISKALPSFTCQFWLPASALHMENREEKPQSVLFFPGFINHQRASNIFDGKLLLLFCSCLWYNFFLWDILVFWIRLH